MADLSRNGVHGSCSATSPMAEAPLWLRAGLSRAATLTTLRQPTPAPSLCKTGQAIQPICSQATQPPTTTPAQPSSTPAVLSPPCVHPAAATATSAAATACARYRSSCKGSLQYSTWVSLTKPLKTCERLRQLTSGWLLARIPVCEVNLNVRIGHTAKRGCRCTVH